MVVSPWHYPAIFCTFAGFVLHIFITVSAPIWDKIYFLQLNTGIVFDISDYPSRLNVVYGVFGYEVKPATSYRRLGYSPAGWDNSSWKSNPINDSRLTEITYALVLHPIAAGLALLALICAIKGTRSRTWAVLAALLSGFTTIISLVVFAVDIVLFTWVRNAFEYVLFERTANYGPAMWMALGAVIALGISTVCTGVTIFSRNHYPRKWSKAQTSSSALPQAQPTYRAYASE